MKIADLTNVNQIIAEDRSRDQDFAAEWDRSAYARAIAIAVLRFRADRGLSQRALAKLTGLQQPAIARLERGEDPPALSTLAKLSRATGLEFQLRIAGGDVAAPLIRQPKGGMEYRSVMPFEVRYQDHDKLTADQLEHQQQLLEAELMKLEGCNDMKAPVVTVDYDGSIITISMTMIGGPEGHAVQIASNICRTAIHGIGGSTPDWDTPRDDETIADFRPTGVRLEPVST
jgi:transcriptional regulator with XRE-family HTH domain